jgi:ATP-dependent Clp protease adaptor protein ClpS
MTGQSDKPNPVTSTSPPTPSTPSTPAAGPTGGEDDAGGDGAGESSVGVVTERRVRTQRPSMFKVLLHNDDYTPMEFVTEVLERFFAKTHAEATEIMLAVHHKGLGVCGVFPYEIAETKVAQVTEAAREQEYPLQCTMERA